MELEALMISLATLTALAAVVGLAWTLRLDYDDSLQLVSDVYRLVHIRGCVVRAYSLRSLRVVENGIELPGYVIWGGAVMYRIPVPAVADKEEYFGHVILEICYNGTHLIIASRG